MLFNTTEDPAVLLCQNGQQKTSCFFNIIVVLLKAVSVLHIPGNHAAHAQLYRLHHFSRRARGDLSGALLVGKRALINKFALLVRVLNKLNDI